MVISLLLADDGMVCGRELQELRKLNRLGQRQGFFSFSSWNRNQGWMFSQTGAPRESLQLLIYPMLGK